MPLPQAVGDDEPLLEPVAQDVPVGGARTIVAELPVSVTSVRHPASSARSIRVAKSAPWPPFPRCSGSVAANPKYAAGARVQTAAAAAGSSPSSARKASQPGSDGTALITGRQASGRP